MTQPEHPPAVDLSDPTWLPVTGPARTTLIEASAGTGKTWMIAALAARTVARDGVPIEKIMMVTFGRSATRELRARIFERLRSSADALGAALDGRRPSDPVDALLADGSEDDLRERRERLERAIADIDLATIDTTHSFSHRMLAQLGLLVDHDATSRHAEDISRLIDEVIVDHYLAMFRDQRDAPRFREMRALGKAALRHPGVELYPAADEGSQPHPLSQIRTEWCQGVRARLADRLRRLGLHTFDDMVLRLSDALGDPVAGPRAAQLLSSRFPIVLVDEFQDTDPDQWQILESAFHHRSTLVLIGDPKQSIYGFRGADVYAYLAAGTAADDIATLPVNHRSDPGVVAGISTLFGGAALGDPGIVVRPVRAQIAAARLHGHGLVAWDRPVQLRAATDPNPQSRAKARSTLLDDVTTQIVAMLDDQAEIHDDRGPRRLEARDIAVLVRTNGFGQQLHACLQHLGVPAIFPGNTSVFSDPDGGPSPAAQAWALVLTALADPGPQTFSRAALSLLIGYEPAQLAAAGAAERSALSIQLRTLSVVLQERGVAATFESIAEEFDLHRRILGRHDGERLMADLRQVGEILHEVHTRRGLTAAALSGWLTTQIAEAKTATTEDRTRRLETDDAAVQILTVHRAKGLQFPVVLVPEASDLFEGYEDEPVLRHEKRDGGWVRVLDVGGDPGAVQRRAAAGVEQADEALRLLYVAATRAMSRLVLWWVPVRERDGGASAPLSRLLFSPTAASGSSSSAAVQQRFAGRIPDPQVSWSEPLDLGWLASDDVQVCTIGTGQPTPRSRPVPALTVHARTWNRTIDTTWRRTSYSALTADSHATPSPFAPDTDEPLVATNSDGPQLPQPTDQQVRPTGSDRGELTQPLVALPGGTAFGSLVHEVLERCDFTAPDLRAHLRDVCAAPVAAARLPGVEAETVVDGLQQVIETDLGSLTDGQALRAFGPRDLLPELAFDLAMGGSSLVGDLAELLSDPTLVPADDPLAEYGPVLAQAPAASQSLNGILTGSIDACLRVRRPDGGTRFVVVDYKTNRLPTAHGEVLTPQHYTSEAMASAMIASHYPLQALLYSVAVHRFLSLRLPDYDPVAHLGGVGYLFVRGMVGGEAPQASGMPLGVFTWFPSAALVSASSQTLGETTKGRTR